MKKIINTSLSKNKHLGLSLIELMISMTIGIFLVAGIMSMYFGSRVSDKTRTELSDIDANARIALRALKDTIQHAGYRSVENLQQFEKPFYTESDGDIDDTVVCSDNKKLVVSPGLLNPPTELEGFTKDNDNGDSLTVVYLADNPGEGQLYYDCATLNNSVSDSSSRAYHSNNSDLATDKARQLACSTDKAHPQLTPGDIKQGMINSIDAKIYSGFFLRKESGKPKQLVCYGSRSESNTPLVIADNIENMQFLYGVSNAGLTTFKNATDVENNDEWASVSSVKIAILVGSEDEKVLENPTDRTYQLLDKVVSIGDDDLHMYKVYTTTVSLQNKIPRGLK